MGNEKIVKIQEWGNKGKLNNSQPIEKPKRRRSKNGCTSCKKMRIKCNEDKPRCEYCVHTQRECVYQNSKVASVATNSKKQVKAPVMPSSNFQQLEQVENSTS